MYISFFIGRMVSGGAERVIQLLANHFAGIGWKVDIALLLGNEVNREQFPLDETIRIVDLSGSGESYKSNAAGWLRSVRSYVKENKPDCLVSFVGRINALVLTATAGLGIPTLVSERNDPKHDGRGKMMQAFCNLIYRRADAIVFQTAYEQSCFSRRLDKKSHVIPNPVSVSADAGIPENPAGIATAGRLVPQKNQAMLIDAVAIAARTCPEIQCDIYGEGELRTALEEKIRETGQEDRVRLPGNKTDIHRWVAGSRFFALTSDFEGLPNALIEAMMLGRTCITTDYPGADEVIENGKNGIIVRRGNAGMLAEQIIRLIRDPALCGQLAENARRTSDRYSVDTVVQAWKTVIGQVTVSA